MNRRVALLAVVALLVATWSTPALAHTDLVGSIPRDSTTVSSDTDRLVLVYGDDVLPGSEQVVVRAVDDDADAVAGPASVSGGTVEVPLARLGPGPHEVTYRVVAGDGHTVVGRLAFTVVDSAPATGTGRRTSAAGPDGPVGPERATVEPVVAPPELSGGVVPPVWWALGSAAAAAATVLVLRLALRRRGTA